MIPEIARTSEKWVTLSGDRELAGIRPARIAASMPNTKTDGTMINNMVAMQPKVHHS